MLLPRVISAVIFGPLFLGLVWVGFPWFDLLIGAMAAIMAMEFAAMDGERGVKRRSLIAVAAVAAVAAMTFISATAALLVIIVTSAGVIIADYVAGRRGLSLIYVAVPYVALPALAMLYVRGLDAGGAFNALSVFWLLAIVWGTDIGAYACGRIIGGPKLAPAISPKKTWSGAIGGLVFGVGVSAAVLWFYGAPIGPKPLIVALVAAVATEAGDLLESGLKRWYEVKDSGTLIPGHGGLMDRFDGLWAAAPVVALFCWVFGGGVHQVGQSSDPVQKTVTILGATGSIGDSTIDLILCRNPGAYRVVALTAHKNCAKLAAQAKALKPQMVACADPNGYAELKEALRDTNIHVAAGPEGVCEAAGLEADWVMAAIVGAAGLQPTLTAVRRGAQIALANKECLVCAGDLFMGAVREHGATLLPVDSEHNAIFQVFDFEQHEKVTRILLTASGGPFRTKTRAEMAGVTPAQAVAHPNWSMGAKISVNSATMMNKGLELIEAHHLFGMSEDRIEILVHPQSVVHSMVEYADGSVLAQLGTPDMRTPIAFALAWPKRMEAPAARLDLAALKSLTFEAPDLERFPALRLTREALKAGGAAPTILNAANEVAVARFLAGEIGFLDIAAVVEETLAAMTPQGIATLDDVMGVDTEARRIAARGAGQRAAKRIGAAAE